MVYDGYLVELFFFLNGLYKNDVFIISNISDSTNYGMSLPQLENRGCLFKTEGTL